MASFILWLFLIQRGGFLHSANAPVGMTDVSGLAVTNVNVPRFRPCGRMAADCRRYSGGTMFWVVPFTPTDYTSNVAGGRLPPLRYICYKYRIFYVSNVGLSFRIMGKTRCIDVAGGRLPPLLFCALMPQKSTLSGAFCRNYSFFSGSGTARPATSETGSENAMPLAFLAMPISL